MSHGTGFLLLSAAVGYWVLERASTHKGQLKHIGFFVGSFLIIVSVLGVLCYVWCASAGKLGYCPMGKGVKGAYSPYQRPVP